MPCFCWRKRATHETGTRRANQLPAGMDRIPPGDIKSESTKTRTSTINGVTTVITERTITTHDGRTMTETQERTEGSDGRGGVCSASSDPVPTGTSTGSVDLNTFRENSLKAHNERRARHGVPPLKLSWDLNDYAQNWAEHLAKTNSFQHSDCMLNGGRLGENIAYKWSSAGADFIGDDAIEQWYSEIKQHDFRSDRGSNGTGHFTQMVWKDTTELGMGKAKDGKGKVIAVSCYRPPGNMIGSYTQQVFPPK